MALAVQRESIQAAIAAAMDGADAPYKPGEGYEIGDRGPLLAKCAEFVLQALSGAAQRDKAARRADPPRKPPPGQRRPQPNDRGDRGDRHGRLPNRQSALDNRKPNRQAPPRVRQRPGVPAAQVVAPEGEGNGVHDEGDEDEADRS